MVTQRLLGLLPPLTLAESIAVIKVPSLVAEVPPSGLVRQCPFRAPGSTLPGSSAAARSPVPGSSPWATPGCSSWASYRRSGGTPWKACGDLWKMASYHRPHLATAHLPGSMFPGPLHESRLMRAPGRPPPRLHLLGPLHRPTPIAHLDPLLDRKVVRELAGLSFEGRAHNVVLLEPPGAGKTHLAVALGVNAIEAGDSVLFLSWSF